MNTVFDSAPLRTGAWLRITGAAVAGYVAVELAKLYRRPAATGELRTVAP
ncbi:MAG: hypothetical protein JWO67_3793 [Streptosporangiaceae bacterium]|jgi:hypothetical protein|nr:hypothetical protein [Streptosporangiaceae bacterium]